MLNKIKSLLKQSNQIRKYFSFRYSFWTFNYEIFGHINNSLDKKIAICCMKKKSKYIFNYLDKHYQSILLKYKDQSVEEDIKGEYPIWFFWYQSIEQAPDLVKACLNNLKRKYENDNKVRIHVVTRENLEEYVSIPDSILDKVGKQITLTHFSDLVRVKLLAQKGGCWIDSTCFLKEKLPESIFKYSFYSCKTENVMEPVIANSEWVTWFLFTNKREYKLFKIIEEVFQDYFTREDLIIDYLFFDHIIRWAYLNIPDIKKDITRVPENNVARNDLMAKFGLSYNKYGHILEDNPQTFIYKLSYKKQYPKMIDGEKTFFGMLCDEEI